jgi:hypothetical protein
MIKASEARKVTAEAQEAIKKNQTLKEARRLEKLFEKSMVVADQAVKSAMKLGAEQVELRMTKEEMPNAVRERFEDQLLESGYSYDIRINDEGDGYEILINWRSK